MRVDVLGSLRVLDDNGNRVFISDSKVASALLVLALEAGNSVAIEALVQAAYGQDGLCGLEEDWVAGHIANLREMLGSARDGTPYVHEAQVGPARYGLRLAPSGVDALEFATGVEHVLRHGLELSLDQRVAKERAVFALWRADPVTQHRRICRAADRLFKRHQRLYRQLGELLARDLSASGDRDAAEDVLDAVLDVYQGDAELLLLRETLAAETVRTGESSGKRHSAGGGLAPERPASQTFHVIEASARWRSLG